MDFVSAASGGSISDSDIEPRTQAPTSFFDALSSLPGDHSVLQSLHVPEMLEVCPEDSPGVGSRCSPLSLQSDNLERLCFGAGHRRAERLYFRCDRPADRRSHWRYPCHGQQRRRTLFVKCTPRTL